jgi:FkbM family methyltransferase
VLRRPILFRDRYGLRYSLEPSDDLALYFLHRGWFEEADQEFCRAYVKPGMSVIDVGAYIGMYACFLAKLVGPDGRVHAFEPVPRSCKRLIENIARNELTNVSINQEAISSGDGPGSLFVYDPPFESFSSLMHEERIRRDGLLKSTTKMVVSTTSLDAYCRNRGISRIDLLKLDAEGAEADIVKGAHSLLREGRVGAVLFEVGTGGKAVMEYLKQHDFCFYAINADGTLQQVKDSCGDRGVNLVALHQSRACSNLVRHDADRN